MSSKTKIVVLHMKEVIYTLVFLFLAIILGIVLFFMFGPGKSGSSSGSAKSRYTPGVYSSSITLNDNAFDVEVTVDSHKINSIELVNLSESVSAMYPLVEPAMETLASQIYSTQSVENLLYSEDSKYTSMVLLNAIEDALKKAENS